MKKPASGGRFGNLVDLGFMFAGGWRCRQTNTNSSLFSQKRAGLGGEKLAPFEERGIAVQFEAGS